MGVCRSIKSYDGANTYTLNITEGKIPYASVSGTPSFADVATSGNYNDLSNKPSLYSDANINNFLAKAGIRTQIVREWPPMSLANGGTFTSGTYIYTTTIDNNFDNLGFSYGVVNMSTYYGNGNYYHYLCFNKVYPSEVGGHWKAGEYTSGVYNSTTNYLVSGYYGDWLTIQLPQQIKLYSFKIYPRYNNGERCPKDFKIYGSNDGAAWTEIYYNALV